MPNGDDKNLVRFCAALEGFHSRSGKWPTRVVMDDGYARDLLHIVGAEAFQRVTSRLEIVRAPGATFRAEDLPGESYDYGTDGFAARPPVLRAREWLGLDP